MSPRKCSTARQRVQILYPCATMKTLNALFVASLSLTLTGVAQAAPVADAVSALTNLGYSRDQAANAVAAAMKTAGEDADSAKLIRLGLRELSR